MGDFRWQEGTRKAKNGSSLWYRIDGWLVTFWNRTSTRSMHEMAGFASNPKRSMYISSMSVSRFPGAHGLSICLKVFSCRGVSIHSTAVALCRIARDIFHEVNCSSRFVSSRALIDKWLLHRAQLLLKISKIIEPRWFLVQRVLDHYLVLFAREIFSPAYLQYNYSNHNQRSTDL